MIPFNNSMAGQAGKTTIDSLFATTLGDGSQGFSYPLAFAPEFVWQKSRSQNQNHALFDSLRGQSRLLSTNNTTGQSTQTGTFGPSGNEKTTGPIFVSPISVNWSFRRSKRFFDIVVYTGNGTNRQIPHNLGLKPGFIVIKSLTTTSAWTCYHGSIPSTQAIELNTTGGSASNSAWNSTDPSATNFSLSVSSSVNQTGTQYVAYLFADDARTDGFIRCGSVTGNGNQTNSALVNLGWQPQWLIYKSINTTQDWAIFDNKRISGNSKFILRPNASTLETTASTGLAELNFTQNGFQFGANEGSRYNINGIQYLYIAIRKGFN